MKRFFCFILLMAIAACHSARTSPDKNKDPRKTEELGKKLFFDNRLSKGNQMSCATCHRPEKAFTNGETTARGVHGEFGERNVPTLVNRYLGTIQFWDGRAASLEDQVAVVVTSAVEMGADLNEVLSKFRADPDYPAQFRRAFGEEGIDARKIARALAAYERTLRTVDAPYDRFKKGDKGALTAGQRRGMNLFFKEFKCGVCHSGANFTDEALRPRCYPATNNLAEFRPIPVDKDKWIKTPTLRNLKYTAPYLHNGVLTKLEQVVDFYSPSFQAAGPEKLPDARAPVVRISPRQRKDLVDFLLSLSADRPYVEVFSEPEME